MEEEQKTEKPKRKFSFNLKMSRWDKISIIVLVVFIILVVLPTLTPKGNCEVARPGYECASVKDVMIENCQYWGEYDCITEADVSLPQIEWYIENLCNLQNQYHDAGLDCSNLKMACNEITASLVCP